MFYVVLSRNYGFGINSEEFERLALSLPYKYILKHSDSLFQVEALMFGQAGVLEETLEDDYYMRLKNEYKFLKTKYKLEGIEGYVFKKMRYDRIFPKCPVPACCILQKSGRLFSAILKMKDYREFFNYLQTEPSDYWQSYYSLVKFSKKQEDAGCRFFKCYSDKYRSSNAFAYGKKSGYEEYCACNRDFKPLSQRIIEQENLLPQV